MDIQGPRVQAHFADVRDPRKAWNQDHRLWDILVVALCAIICGAGIWVAVAPFAQVTLPGLRQVLAFPNGAPAPDTLSRVFAARDPE